jgi:hypothetical protein
LKDYDGIEARLLRSRGDMAPKGTREPHLVCCAWLATQVYLPMLRVFEVSVAVAESGSADALATRGSRLVVACCRARTYDARGRNMETPWGCRSRTRPPEHAAVTMSSNQ